MERKRKEGRGRVERSGEEGKKVSLIQARQCKHRRLKLERSQNTRGRVGVGGMQAHIIKDLGSQQPRLCTQRPIAVLQML
jgi:hypothetical protein